MKDEKSIRDFIYSLMKTDNKWANAHLAVINMTVTDNSLFNLISEFRNHTRMTASVDLKHSIHAAFSIDQNYQNQFSQNFDREGNRNRGRDIEKNNFSISFRSLIQSKKCLCDLIH